MTYIQYPRSFFNFNLKRAVFCVNRYRIALLEIACEYSACYSVFYVTFYIALERSCAEGYVVAAVNYCVFCVFGYFQIKLLSCKSVVQPLEQ